MQEINSGFWKFVVKTEPEACWLWDGYKHLGYGRYADGPKSARKKHQAHRYLYQHTVGQIPQELVLDHLCGTPNCVNPDHMEPVSQRVNVLRSSKTNPAVINAEKTHCHRGHEFDEANTRIMPNGGRTCRACMRLWYHQNKEKTHGRNSTVTI